MGSADGTQRGTPSGVRSTNYCVSLLGVGNPSFPYKLVKYGATLEAGKASLNDAMAGLKISPDRQAFFMVIAMIETNRLGFWQHDSGKDDRTDQSRNYSIFNLNEYFLNRLMSPDYARLGQMSVMGSQPAPTKPLRNSGFEILNSRAGTGIAVAYMDKALDLWGIKTFLECHRGGATAMIDHHSYDVAGYVAAVAQGLCLIDFDPSLMASEIRIEMDVTPQ